MNVSGSVSSPAQGCMSFVPMIETPYHVAPGVPDVPVEGFQLNPDHSEDESHIEVGLSVIYSYFSEQGPLQNVQAYDYLLFFEHPGAGAGTGTVKTWVFQVEQIVPPDRQGVLLSSNPDQWGPRKIVLRGKLGVELDGNGYIALSMGEPCYDKMLQQGGDKGRAQQAICYAQRYMDLAVFFKCDLKGLEQHWENTGVNEGRSYGCDQDGEYGWRDIKPNEHPVPLQPDSSSTYSMQPLSTKWSDRRTYCGSKWTRELKKFPPETPDHQGAVMCMHEVLKRPWCDPTIFHYSDKSAGEKTCSCDLDASKVVVERYPAFGECAQADYNYDRVWLNEYPDTPEECLDLIMRTEHCLKTHFHHAWNPVTLSGDKNCGCYVHNPVHSVADAAFLDTCDWVTTDPVFSPGNVAQYIVHANNKNTCVLYADPGMSTYKIVHPANDPSMNCVDTYSASCKSARMLKSKTTLTSGQSWLHLQKGFAEKYPAGLDSKEACMQAIWDDVRCTKSYFKYIPATGHCGCFTGESTEPTGPLNYRPTEGTLDACLRENVAQHWGWGQSDDDKRNGVIVMLNALGLDTIEELQKKSNTELLGLCPLQGANLYLVDYPDSCYQGLGLHYLQAPSGSSGLAVGDWLVSQNSKWILTPQSDGNLVRYTGLKHLDPTWASGTFNAEGATLVIQEDANMVVYAVNGGDLWGANSHGHDLANAGPGPFKMVMALNGDVQIWNGAGRKWSLNQQIQQPVETRAFTDAPLCGSNDPQECTFLCSSCSPGTGLYQETNECRECPIGTYSPGIPEGTYSPSPGAVASCLVCPPGKLTSMAGATSATQCDTLCPAGKTTFPGGEQFLPFASPGSTWRDEGPECIPCPEGMYLNEATKICNNCQGAMAVLNGGSTFEDCQLCPPGQFLKTTGYDTLFEMHIQTCSDCPVGMWKSNQEDLVCNPCPTGLTTVKEFPDGVVRWYSGATSIDDCTVPPPCTCKEAWTDPLRGCDMIQKGCPAISCGATARPWCMVENPGCLEDEGLGWFYCGSNVEALSNRALSGLLATYYFDLSETVVARPDLVEERDDVHRMEASINRDFNQPVPDEEWFAFPGEERWRFYSFSEAISEKSENENFNHIRWSGVVRPGSGTDARSYNFKVFNSGTEDAPSPERVKVWIDNQLVIDQWSSLMSPNPTFSKELSDNFYPITVEVKNAQYPQLQWSVEMAGAPEPAHVVIPAANLFVLSDFCDAGYAHNPFGGPCAPCPKGTYKVNKGLGSCTSCPPNAVTLHEGSSQVSV
jgi:hypothetical protein